MKVLMIYHLIVIVFTCVSCLFSSEKVGDDVVVAGRTGSLQAAKRCSNVYGDALRYRVNHPLDLSDEFLPINSPEVKENLSSICLLRHAIDTTTIEDCQNPLVFSDIQEGCSWAVRQVEKVLKSPALQAESSAEFIKNILSSELCMIKRSATQNIQGYVLDYHSKHIAQSDNAAIRSLFNEMNNFQQKYLVEDVPFRELRTSFVDIKARYVCLYCQLSPQSKLYFEKEFCAMTNIYNNEQSQFSFQRKEKIAVVKKQRIQY